MKIQYERTGGFMGMKLRCQVDTHDLEPGEREELESLVASAGFFDVPFSPPAPGADRFTYRVVIEEDGQERVLEGGESVFPESWQPLLRRLEVLARQR